MMNFSSVSSQEPLATISSKFQDMSLSGSSTPLAGDNVVPLSKPGSLLDTLGIQRSGSPFVTPQTNAQPILQQQSTLGLQQPTITPGWTQPALNGTQMLPQLPHFAPGSTPDVQQRSTNPMGVPNPAIGEFIGMGANGTALPPGMFVPTVVESQWKYIDNQGQVQGPFPSHSMKAWYQAGYLQSSLQIYRVATSPEPFGFNDTFASLGELISKVGDFTDPFGKLDLILSQNQTQVNPTMPPFAMAKEHGVRRSQIDSPDYTHAQILQLRDPTGGFYHEVVSQIPVDKFVEKVDKIDSFSHVEEMKQRQLKELEYQRRFGKAEKQRQEQALQETRRKEEESRQYLLERDLASRRSAEKETIVQQKFNIVENILHDGTELNKISGEDPPLKQVKQQTDNNRVPLEAEFKSKEKEADNGVSPAPKPAKLAPWATKTSQVVPAPSLAEIQQKEAAESARRKHEQEIKSSEVAAKLKQQVFEQEKPTVSIESIAPWASKKSTTPLNADPKRVVKSFEQVQKQQLEEKKFVAEQKRLWEEAQRAAKLKTDDNLSLPVENKEWTTVVKKQPVSSKLQSSKVMNQPSSYISPDKLRSMSAGKTNQIGSSTSIPTLKNKVITPAITSYTGNASTSERQEFLKWCRSQMKLSPGVEVNGVLEVLLSLPAGSEAKEIIADTIYSNSSIMDGRRFATDFIKRRIDCEKRLNDPLTWSEALSMPEGHSDDWEFQVVTKKKNRKH